MKTDRLLGLELLRFLAAIGVLVWHYQHFMFIGHGGEAWDWTRLPLHRLFAPFYIYGYEGVELFWCISGFIFTWKYGGPVSRSVISFGRFAWFRFSRLYPLHLITLLAVAVMQRFYVASHGETFVYVFNDVPHFIMNLFLANWWGFQSGESFNGPSWSVSAEVLIYVVFFWVCRLAGTGWRTDLFALTGFSCAAWLAKVLFDIKLSFTGAGTFFYLGALTFHLYVWIETLSPVQRRRVIAACAAAIVIPAGLVAVHVLKIAGGSLPMFPAAVLLSQLCIRPSGQRAQACLTGFGNLTYASYMLHFPMQLAAMLVFGTMPLQASVYTDWFMLAYLGSVLAASYLVFRFIERPAQNWLRRQVVR